MTRPVTAPGRVVAGRYRLHSQIGGGGMGAVWLARDELLGRRVAVKQVLLPTGADPAAVDQQRQRALREGRIAARLSHAHAIAVYDVALENGQPWLVMEYLPSRSLAAVLDEDGTLRVDQVAQIGAQVADALAATHAAGIVHRDVKPANVLIGQGAGWEGLVKITDFGISHASGDVTLTQTGQITGTPAFLAPEVAQGREMTEASDVFSLGATLYTCLEGMPPFGMDENALGMLHKVASGEIRPPERAGSLTEPLLRMLAADPARRPSMTVVRDELAKLAAGRDGDTTTVLLARTDLRPSSPSRTQTLEPAPAPAVGSTPPPAPPPPAPPSPGRRSGHPPSEAEPDERRRMSKTWLAVAAVLAVLTALIVYWVAALDGGGGSGRDGGTAATASRPDGTAQETGGSPAHTAGGTTEQQQTTEATPADGAAATIEAKDVEDFLKDYHKLVLDDPQQAWTMTGPTLRNAIGSEQAYVDYWGQFDDVKISDIQAADGQDTATATMELRHTDGTKETGQHRFTFLLQDGRLILDSDFPV